MLEERFKSNWKCYVKTDSVYKPAVGTPFWHLNYEPFWHLVPFDGGNEQIMALQKSNPYSLNLIRKHIKYAVIDKDLFDLLQDETPRKCLIEVLIKSIESNNKAVF